MILARTRRGGNSVFLDHSRPASPHDFFSDSHPMRRLLLSLTAGLALLATASQAGAPTLSVPIDQSARLLLPPGARDVMIGNPAIADLNVIDGRSVVVLGKGYGVTNLLVIDALGRTVLERQIVVSGPNSGRVSVIRGAH